MNKKIEKILATAAIIALTIPMAARSGDLEDAIWANQRLCDNPKVQNRQRACDYAEELRATEPIRQQVARENQREIFGKVITIESVPASKKSIPGK